MWCCEEEKSAIFTRKVPYFCNLLKSGLLPVPIYVFVLLTPTTRLLHLDLNRKYWSFGDVTGGLNQIVLGYDGELIGNVLLQFPKGIQAGKIGGRNDRTNFRPKRFKLDAFWGSQLGFFRR